MAMLAEFRTFINRGNVLDLAVGVITGAAFGKIVTALTDDLIAPILSLVTGGVDFSDWFVPLASVPANVPHTLAGMKAAGVPILAVGHFLTEIIDFLILAWIVFLIVRFANRVLRREVAEAGPTEVALLAEIRDELRARS